MYKTYLPKEKKFWCLLVPSSRPTKIQRRQNSNPKTGRRRRKKERMQERKPFFFSSLIGFFFFLPVLVMGMGQMIITQTLPRIWRKQKETAREARRRTTRCGRGNGREEGELLLLLCGAESVVSHKQQQWKRNCEVCGSSGRIRGSVGGSGMG